MAFDISEVVLDEDLGEDFVILRSTGSFGAGGWIQGPEEKLPSFGVLTPASDEALAMVPEGDRVEGSMQIYCAEPIYETLASRPGECDQPGGPALSDKVRWHGNLYRVMSRQVWVDYGYWSALLMRLPGE